MMTRSRVFAAIMVAFCFPGAVFSGGAGGTEDIFSFGAGARAVSLGRTFVGLADDISALYWNPAGIYNIDKKTVSAFYSQLFGGTMYGFMGYVHPTADYGSIGLGVMSLYTGDITGYDASSYALDSFNSGRMKFILSYANQLPWFPLTIGFSAKMNYISIENYSGTSFNFDFALQYDFIKQSFKDKALGRGRDDVELVAGFVFRNILLNGGERLTEETDEERYQMVLGISFMKRVKPYLAGRAVVDLVISEDQPLAVSSGLEAIIYKNYFVRLGYALHSGFSFGAGMRLSDWDIDYALAFRDLGATHNFSVSWRFGEGRTDILRAREEAVQKRIRDNVLRERKTQDDKYSTILKQKDENYSKDIKQKDEDIKKRDQLIADLEKQRKEQLEQANKRIQDLQRRSDEEVARYRQRLDDTIRTNEQQIKDLQKKREDDLKKLQDDMNQQIKGLQDSHKQRMDSLDATYRDKLAALSVTNQMERDRLTRRLAAEKDTLKRQEEAKSKDYVKGLELYNRGLYEEALKHFQAVAALDPRYADTQLYINRIRAQNQNIATYSQQIRSYYQQGVKLYLDGEFQRAIAIWQEILKIDPYNKLALKNIEMATKRLDFLKKYNR